MQPSNRSCGRLLCVGVAAAVAALGLTQAAAGGSTPDTFAAPEVPPVNVGTGSRPSISSDGRYVVYAAASASEDGRTSTVWLRDQDAGSVVELTTPNPDVRLGNSTAPSISADGCVVVVVTEVAYDLFRDDDLGARWDVYRAMLPQCGGTLGDWQLVSEVAGDGIGGATDGVSALDAPAISGSGSVIAYVDRFSVATPEISAITVVDLTIPPGQPGRSVRVGGTPFEAPNTTFRYLGLREPAISDDGDSIAFTSDANSTNAVPDWASGPQPGGFAVSQVFIWNRADPNPATAVTAVSSSAGAANGGAARPAISANGQFVAFQSTATNLIASVTLAGCVATCPSQVYRFDRADGSTMLISGHYNGTGAATAITPGNGAAVDPAINGDGSEVVYVSKATNLFATSGGAGGGPNDGDIVVASPNLAQLRRVSLLADGVTPLAPVNSGPAVSATGRIIVFDSLSGPTGGGRQLLSVVQDTKLSFPDLDLGTVYINNPSPEWFIEVLNQGASSFIPTIVESSNPEFAITGGTCILHLPVAPGGYCSVNLMLTPLFVGPTDGTITVAEEGFAAASIEAEVSGSGGTPMLNPTPGGARWEPLVVGELGPVRTFTLTNIGFAPISISRLTVVGAHPQDFKIISHTCRSRQVMIGQSCTLDVLFSPTGSGHRMARIKAAASTGEYTSILLNGDATYAPTVTVSESAVTAGGLLGVAGSGFAADTAVTVLWADGSGRTYTAQTDDNGQFLVSIVLLPGERAGGRVLVAQSASGESASVAVRVIARPARNGATDPAFD